jgi:hypothetical protein
VVTLILSLRDSKLRRAKNVCNTTSGSLLRRDAFYLSVQS